VRREWLFIVAIVGCKSDNPRHALVPAPAANPNPSRVEVSHSPPTAAPEVKQTSLTAPEQTEPVKATDVSKAAPTPAELVAKAEAFYAKTPSYTCRLTRQERLGNRLQPVEKMLLHFRNKPRSVYYRWVGEACAGRECVWVENANDGKIVSKGGKSDFGMKGMRVAVAPDSFLATSRSRYKITESGQDVQCRKLRELVDRMQNGSAPADALKYIGLEQPTGVAVPMHHVVETIGRESKLFPRGGTRDWYFDPLTGRIVLVEAKDPNGERQEFYHFEHLFANDTLTDADFDADVVFAKPDADKDGTGKAEPPK
jgi:hypothetical protein